MKRNLAAVLAAFPLILSAQTAPVATAAGEGSAVAAVRLDPFEVKTDRDNSYGALNSNSITRFNTALDKTPVSADVFSSQFMDDVGATDINSMLTTYGGVGAVMSNPSSDALQNQPGDRVVIGDRFTPQQLSYRGLSAGNIRRDGFEGFPTKTSAMSNFDIDRVETLHGPEGLLYGAGGGGGTIIATTKSANFNKSTARLQTLVDQYGSKRLLVDANEGNDFVATRFSFVTQDTQTRRVNIGDNLKGSYGQIAFKLPLNTILRIEGEYTTDYAILPGNGSTVNFGGAANDSRNGTRLDNLLFTNQTGAINPTTGAAYSKYGAIDNGNLNWGNVDSYGGSMRSDLIQNYILTARADTVWTSWLSTNVGVHFDRDTDRSNGTSGPTAPPTLDAPLLNGNPNNDWGIGSSMADVLNQQLYKEFRASVLVTKNFFDDRIKTQTAGGYDTLWKGYGAIDDTYYLADSSGNISVNQANLLSSNLGRTPIPNQFWTVGNGPVMYPFNYKRGQPQFVSPATGLLYTRTELNPRSPMWVSPGNPLGDASLYETTPLVTVNKGVGGIGQGGYAEQLRTSGYYFANYTSWWGDWIDTLIGYRMTKTHSHIPNGSSNIYGSDYVQPSSFSDPSYNLGLDGRITNSLRWFADISATYNDGVGQDDPIGNPPPPTYSHGWEAGIKFTPLKSKISGSFEYYHTSDHNDNINYGGQVINSINPVGISNVVYTGPAGRNTFVDLDEKSSGLELTLTAQPTENWRIQVQAIQSAGTILTNKKYGIRYNDQFYTDGKGNVTYADGSAFLVPVDASAATLTKLTTTTNPTTFLTGVPTQQLTTAMIGNPASAYYAWAGNPVNLNGQIDSGLAGTPLTPVGAALRFFSKTGVGTAATGVVGLPFSSIQYAWPDPAGTGGTYTVAQSGDPTTNGPVFSLSIVNNYSIPSGWFKGAGLTVDLNNKWQNRTYIYNTTTGARPLFAAPELGWQVNLHPYYRHKFGRIWWRTQLDIYNLTNHYLLTLAPNNGTGFATPQNLGVLWTGQPRRVQWSNTFDF
jgi:hypothetical protein